MSRRFLAAFVVCSWVILSGFDLIEDIRPPEHNILSMGSHEPNAAVLDDSGGLANNIVESALQRLRAYIVLCSSRAATLARAGLSDFPVSFRLYKLYQIFLI
jgi:hypothetical protein